MNGRYESGDRMRSTGVTRRRPRVLIIDDDERLRDVLSLVLVDDCEVTLAASGAEAFDHLAGEQAFDVIVCDLSMPKMGGAEIHATLCERDPEMAARMVIVTGGAYSTASEDFLRESGCPQVPKPFTPNELMGAVHEILLRCGPCPLRRAG